MPGIADAGWQRPVSLTSAVPADVTLSGLAVSPAGAVAAGYDVSNPDQPGAATADVVAFGGGAPTLRGAIPGEQQVLDLAYTGSRLTLLTGTTPAALNLGCCSSVETVTAVPSVPLPPPSPLAGGLGGPSAGQLIQVGATLIALVGNSSGVWVAPSATGGFGPVTQLAQPSPTPPLVAGAGLGDGAWVAAWSPGSPTAPVAGIRTQIDAVLGGRGQPLQPTRIAATVPAGHAIDQLAAAPDPPSATIAFTQSWVDRRGDFHSRIDALEVGARRAVAVTPANQIATGMSFASGPGDYEVLAWQACSRQSIRCTAEASLRPPGGRWSPPLALGPIDATATIAALETASDTAIVGRIVRGNVWVSAAGPDSLQFARATQLSSTGEASSLTLAAGAGGTAVAAWTTGIATQSVTAAGYRP